jgi:hypothetical protein
MALPMEVETLAARVRALLAAVATSEQRMFGGVAFFLDGNMLCCAGRKGLMVRVGKGAEREALARPFAAPCLGTGRPMAGFIMVDPQGVADDGDMTQWLALARTYVAGLPPKSAGNLKARTPKPARGAAA